VHKKIANNFAKIIAFFPFSAIVKKHLSETEPFSGIFRLYL